MNRPSSSAIFTMTWRKSLCRCCFSLEPKEMSQNWAWSQTLNRQHWGQAEGGPPPPPAWVCVLEGHGWPLSQHTRRGKKLTVLANTLHPEIQDLSSKQISNFWVNFWGEMPTRRPCPWRGLLLQSGSGFGWEMAVQGSVAIQDAMKLLHSL